ncbi:hypothetical protein ASE15_03505 [Oerskovia sp. Root22]|nr:hypothetical protein ASE15_03505 [Oerskovia sp. Root22]
MGVRSSRPQAVDSVVDCVARDPGAGDQVGDGVGSVVFDGFEDQGGDVAELAEGGPQGAGLALVPAQARSGVRDRGGEA